MNQVEFEARFRRSETPLKSKDLISVIRSQAGELKICKRVHSFLPCLDWLPNYKFAENLHGDLVTGLTVGVMVVPQGMAYATLAGLEPVYGLYTCFFAAFFYMFFGTSVHVSIGTFAVASMMVGSLRAEIVPDPVPTSELINGTMKQVVQHFKGPIDFGFDVSPTMLTSAITFGVGICQIVMAVCRLSFLTCYISDPLVSGFTTGAAVHVLTAQLDKAIGVKIKRYSGPGMILFMLYDLMSAIPRANLFTVGISAFGIIFLSIGRDFINPWFKKRCSLPLPFELLLVIAAIILSRVLDLKNNYDVRIVDHIPDGMPMPSLPHLELLRYTWMNVFSIALVCFVFVISLEKIFAKKHKYKVEPNQELYALGISSLIASFFPVYPFGASLSRSALCEMTGAKTQLHAFFSSALLFVVILWIGPQLEPLPMAILACIVIVSLKSLFMQFYQLPRLWRISRFDFAIWLIAFFATACLNITYGLGVSVLAVILFTVIKEQWPKFYELSQPDASTDIFRPTKFYNGISNNHGSLLKNKVIEIWRFEAPLHFANSMKFVERVNDVFLRISSCNGNGHQNLSNGDLHKIEVEALVKNVDPAKSLDNLKKLSSFDSSGPSEATDAHTVSAKFDQEDCCAANQLLIPQPSTQSNIPVQMRRLNKLLYARISQDDHKASDADGLSCNPNELTNGETTEATIREADISNETNMGSSETMAGSNNTKSSPSIERFLILDCGAISHVDSMGIEALSEVYKDAKRQNVVLYFAAFSDPILSVLDHCGFFASEIPKTEFFPTIREALNAINKSTLDQ